MPFAAPSICACGRAVPSGHRCSCRIVADRERTRAIDAKRGSASARGYDGQWNRERAAFLRAHPICCMCGAGANVVDHVMPHRGSKKLFWDRNNWQPLCPHCHSSIKQSQERSASQ